MVHCMHSITGTQRYFIYFDYFNRKADNTHYLEHSNTMIHSNWSSKAQQINYYDTEFTNLLLFWSFIVQQID